MASVVQEATAEKWGERRDLGEGASPDASKPLVLFVRNYDKEIDQTTIRPVSGLGCIRGNLYSTSWRIDSKSSSSLSSLHKKKRNNLRI